MKTQHTHLWRCWPARGDDDFIDCIDGLKLGPFDQVEHAGRTFWPVVDDRCKVVRDSLFAYVATPGENSPIDVDSLTRGRDLVGAGS